MSTSKTAKKAKFTGNDGGPDGPIGHWTQRITREKPALISEQGVRCYFIVKNHGPDSAYVVAQYGDHYDLPQDTVRVTYAHGTIRVENRGDKSALIEFDILPLNHK
jgi:hypothetical protein